MNKKKLLITSMLGIFLHPIMAQIKIKALSDLEDGAKQAADTIQSISLYVNVGGIAIALCFCIYFVSSGHPKAKEYVISIFCGLAIYLLAINVIF